MNYHVVFEYTEKADHSAGLRYRVAYQNKVDFDRKRSTTDAETLAFTKVIAEGVSDEESLRLCEAVSIRNRIRHAVGNSIDADGKINRFVLGMELTQVVHTVLDKRKENRDLV